MNLIQTLLQCIYPTLCSQCHELIAPADIFCARCTSSIRLIPSIIYPINKNLSLKVFAVAAYQDPVKLLVLRKFSGDIRASQQLARLMLALTPLRTLPIDYLIPVPLHWTRYAYRGFNQAHEMSKVLSKELNVPTLNLIRRSKKTMYQSLLSSQDRALNVKNAFSLNFKYRMKGAGFLKDKHIVLIDDLCTTGSTLIHISKIIAQEQPASLTAFVGCRAT